MSIEFNNNTVTVKRGNNIGLAIAQRLKEVNIATDHILIDSIKRNTVNRTNTVTLKLKL